MCQKKPEEYFEDDEYASYYNKLVKAANAPTASGKRKRAAMGDGDVSAGIFTAGEIKLIRSSKSYISFEVDLSPVKKEHRDSKKFGLDLYIQIFTSIDTYYSCEIEDILGKPLISAQALLDKAKVPENEKITAINIFEKVDFDLEWLNAYSIDKDVWWFSNHSFIKRFNVIDASKKGWQSFGENKYYVKNNGTLAVKSTTIDEIRYTFDKNGVCTGRYTGWTKSEKGRRYWKNGVLVKDGEFTAPNGKKYSADAQGYVSETS